MNKLNQEAIEKFGQSSTRGYKYKELIEQYEHPNHFKAIGQMITSFGPYIILWTMSYIFWDISLWISGGIIIVNAFFLVRIFIIQHDCGHQSFFAHKTWNNVIGWISSLFSTLPYRYWATVHNHHHGHTGQLEERDIGDIKFLTKKEFEQRGTWGRLRYRIFRWPFVLFVFAPFYYFVFSNRYPFSFDFRRMTKEIKISQLLTTIVLISLFVLGVQLLGWKFLKIQGLTVGVFAIIAFWFFYIQHSFEEAYARWRKSSKNLYNEKWSPLLAGLRGSSRYDIHPLFHWLTGNIGFHHLHHLSMQIPNYNLKQCDKATFDHFKKYVKNLSFRESLDCIFVKLWDEHKQKYITFREFYRWEQSLVA